MTKNAARIIARAAEKLDPAVARAIKDAVTPRPVKPGVPVYARGTSADPGKTTGRTRLCSLEGCGGTRVHVAWPDGTRTMPCLAGMKPYRGGFRIL